MPDISIPYGTGHVNCFIPENRFAGVLQARATAFYDADLAAAGCA